MVSSLWSVALSAVLAFQSANAQSKVTNVPSYSPARPPAIPLAVKSPYTNAWSSTSGNGTLNTNGVIFWPGNSLDWEGMVTVDGVSYEWLGTGSQSLPTISNLQVATPLTVSYDSQYSNFTFAAGPVELTASFLSPVLPKDLCRISLPLSYLSVTAKATDNATHNVQLYNDINGAWISYEGNATLEWSLYQGSNLVTSNGTATGGNGSLYTWLYGLQKPYHFGELYDFPEWGNFTFTSSQGSAQNMTYSSGYSSNVRYSYVQQHTLSNYIDQTFRGSAAREPVFAFSHNLGAVTASGSTAVTYTLGSVQQPVMRYLTSAGVVPLQPWWTKCYGDIFAMIKFHYNDFSTAQSLASQWEGQLKSDIQSYYSAHGVSSSPPYTNGSSQVIFDSNDAYGYLNRNNFSGVAVPGVAEDQAYYSIVALSARQVMGAYVLAIPPNGTGQNASEPLMFQKEISSDGNVNTVDVMYPAMPFFLYANPDLLKYNLEPLFQNQEGGFYPNEYSMHDLGSNFPNATGHVEGNDEYMPVEESGNMILMAYAYAVFSGDTSYLSTHYPLLKQFSAYLESYSLLPGVQLSTDDFAGELVNQTNLATKGIVGLAAMREVATRVGESSDAANFSATANDFIEQWKTFAIDPSGKHTVLSYQYRSSYGLLYNTYPDLLLNLSIIPESVFTMQSEFYPTISQIFGIPLDSRHEYTKSDWEMWTAATCSPSTRALFVTSLAYWLNNTDTNTAFTDLYDTTDGGFPQNPNIYFRARPVAGGHFSLLALDAAGKLGK